MIEGEREVACLSWFSKTIEDRESMLHSGFIGSSCYEVFRITSIENLIISR